MTTRRAQTALTFTDDAFAEAMQASLDLVEERLLKAVDTEQPLLRQSGSHLIRAGGKRFRPMLTLTCAHLGDPDRPNILEAAVALELTHLATLYHDDVMDEAPVRRGAPSANARWDNSVAILTGDWVFSQAAQIMADLGTEAVRLQAATFARLVRGQINETMPRPEGIDAVEWHLGILSEKTGSLIATCAKFGAWFSGADESVTAIAEEYGEVIGVAFQIADDIIDITSDASGKTPGTDLLEGVPTLPVLYALADDDPAGARLRALVSGPVAEEDLEETLTLLRASKALEQAKDTLHQYQARARALAGALPEGPARDALVDICDYMIERDA
ncbi:heptaprenyl diphosphate synthase [Glycomyces artemisiae]|uniref:Heptaprenyl diphosphate synthase n=2 Tax=Glycomyces artemisiae TaxID=1076443 RepID=A0A2T0UT80_9ACTN|nr:polyprenyl synthetase family protein [Glycomyces artemisiae]PRY61135.1 heptaprenyl diphosphate synthase [Glycomyces artemisiae]